MKDYLVKSAGSEFSFDEADLHAFNIYEQEPGSYSIIDNYRSKKAEILEVQPGAKKIKVEVDGEVYEVAISTRLEQELDKLGFNNASTRKVKDIKAPMPGMVLSVAVEEGQEVQDGDRICILEAMKMENSILIHNAATIKKVLVKAGQAVEKNQVLVELE